MIILLQRSANSSGILFRYTCWLKKCVGEESSETPLPSDGLTGVSERRRVGGSKHQSSVLQTHSAQDDYDDEPTSLREEGEIF